MREFSCLFKRSGNASERLCWMPSLCNERSLMSASAMQLVSVTEFLEPLIPRREPLCCDKVRQQPAIGIYCTAKAETPAQVQVDAQAGRETPCTEAACSSRS